MGAYLPYFEQDAFDNLVNNISKNQKKYIGNSDWLKEYFGEEKYISESTIVVPEVILQVSDKKISIEEINHQDYVNVVLIHENYKDIITPQIAANKYMWTALSHTTFLYYVQKRWGIQDIKERYFCTGGRQSLNYYNAISRLWWIGELTYDEKEKYKYTKILLDSGQQTLKDLTDCAYSMNRKITRGVIRAIDKLKSMGSVRQFGDCFRDLNKYINRQGAISSLDFLDEDEIEEIALNYMIMWQNTSVQKSIQSESGL